MKSKDLTGLQKLITALSVRGAKAKVGRDTGLTQRTLILIQQGVSVPNPSTRRLIARSLGHPDSYFLDDQPDSDATSGHEITVQLYVPPDFRMTNDRLNRITSAMVDAGNHIINTIKEIDNETRGRQDGEHSTEGD